MNLYFRLAFREIWNNRSFSFLFILNLIIGLSGLALVDSAKLSIQGTLNQRAKGFLAADFAVGARRPLTESESNTLTSLIPSTFLQTRVIESFSMVASPSNSRLVNLRAIEPTYPFYGSLKLKNAGELVSETKKDLFTGAHVWLYPELLIQLNLKLGDRLRVGQSDLVISDLILEDSASGGSSFAFAPTVYISRDELEKSGLLQLGSTGYFSTLFKAPDQMDLSQVIGDVNKKLGDPAIQVTTAKTASEQVGRLLNYLGDYLSLSGLVAIFLTAIGQMFLFRDFIFKKRRIIATMMCLGFDRGKLFRLYSLQVVLLNLFAFCLTWIVCALLLNTLQAPIRQLLDLPLNLQIMPQTLLLIFCMAMIGSLFICGPLLYFSLQVRPQVLFYPAELTETAEIKKQILWYLPAMGSYYLLSIWLAKSIRVGSLFFGIFAFSLIVLTALGGLFVFFCERWHPKKMTTKLVLRNIARESWGSIALFTTFGLATLLAQLIPQLESGIKTEIVSPAQLKHPSLFLFDIQEEQIEPLTEDLNKTEAVIQQSAPMIRARLTEVNGIPFEKSNRNDEAWTREQENENRFRNRGFNLSYRNELSPAESLVAGTPFRANSDFNQISLEQRFADRLKLKIGDALKFDVQGLNIEGRVMNLRKVRWTSFQPNFFVQFASGPLNDAPKTFLLTLHTPSDAVKNQVQMNVVKKYPNVSALDVTQVITRINNIVTQMGYSLKIMALFSLFVGLVLLLSITNYKIYERRREFNLMKVLGANRSLIENLLLYETLFLLSIAAILGTLMSVGVSYTLSLYLFEGSFALDGAKLLSTFALTVVCAGALTSIMARRLVRIRPLRLLN